MKPLVFCNTSFLTQTGEEVKTWELFNIGGNSPIMHAMWDPSKGSLVCQFNSIKDNLVDYPTRSKQGKVTMSERKMQQYYTTTIKDKSATHFILNTFVGNYTNQDWDIKYEPINVDRITKEQFDDASIDHNVIEVDVNEDK